MAQENMPQNPPSEKTLPSGDSNVTHTPNAATAQVVQNTPAAVKRSMPMALSIMLGILLAAAAGYFFYQLTWFILILYLSFIVATILEAPIEWLAKIGIRRRGLAAVIVMVGGLLIVGLILYLLANAIYGQITSLSSSLDNAPKRINDWIAHLKATHPHIGQRFEKFDANAAMASALPSVESVISHAMSWVEAVTWMVVMFFLVLYMLVDGADHLKGLRSLLPKNARFGATTLFNEVAKAHRGWALASLCNIASSTILTTTGLALIGIPGALVLGFFAGCGELIPNIGPLICSAPAMLFTLVAAPDKFLWVVGMFVVVWTIQGYTISPLMMKFSVELPVLVTIIAVLVFGTLFGFLGILVAIPLVADMVVIWHFYGRHLEKDTTDYDAVNVSPEERRAPMSPDNTKRSRLQKLFRRDRQRTNPDDAKAPSETGIARLERAENRANNG